MWEYVRGVGGVCVVAPLTELLEGARRAIGLLQLLVVLATAEQAVAARAIASGTTQCVQGGLAR